MDYYLYRHIRLDTNQPFYIGIGKKVKFGSYNKEYSRAFEQYNRGKWWKLIVNKASYRVEILLESDDIKFIKEKEIEFIKLYGRRDQNKGTLVNFTDGGDGINNPSIYARKVMADNCRKNFTGSKYNNKKVFVYNLDGSFNGEYSSSKEAGIILGIKGSVSLGRGKYKSKEAIGKTDNYLKGYLWSPIYLGTSILPYVIKKGRPKK